MAINIIVLSLFVEAIVSAIKPVWTKGEGLSVTEIVSIMIGVVLAVALKINMLNLIGDVTAGAPGWVEYVFYVMTGIAIGRGPSFVYDLWEALKNAGRKDEVEESAK